ncbi:HAD-IA family hydrolase [Colwellia psychrerythraea]|uniref:HAD-superfamily hydrolase, subfamily IA, variant 1 n=1 Tax=Colwellia psychrerythraea TaxID=28229 RepID=A0A099KQN9_COLPS|nr:HAD-IA family hydrolase [Colwellia psychrerythraea]KGJ92520.1 HAD-superfamily hydrolase, subfamily IA, variant 1 [Colwellia psychrerythraea]
MQFYRRLTTIKAISFDLDDTLYNNRPIMQAVENKMTDYFTEKFAIWSPKLLSEPKQVFNRRFWAPYRQQAIKAQPNISHDVVRLRFESYRLGLLVHGLSGDEAITEAQAGVDYFINLRSDFTVPKASHELLARLGRVFPLVSISNGNVDTKTLGIDHYFQHIYHAGFQQATHDKNEHLLKQKPETDMFSLVCQQLDILPEQLLHVGDCGFADIHGALNAGCQTAWLPQYGVGKNLQQIPHVELAQVSDLSQLLSQKT